MVVCCRDVKDGDSIVDIKARISKANQAFAMLKTIWRSKNIKIRTKMKIYKSNVLGVLLYGSVSVCQQLEVFQNKVLGVFWPNKISNTELYERTGMEMISVMIKRRRWRWLGHVQRMPPSNIPKVALRWTADGRRSRGRPKETWRRSIEREMRHHGLNWDTARHQAEDRKKWRSLVEALCAT